MEPLKEQIKHGLNEKGDNRPHTALEHFIRLLIHPGRSLLTPFYRYVGKRYTKREKFEIKFLLVDVFLLLVAIGVIASAALWMIDHNKIEKRIFFEAQVAPSEIVSGAPSTLVIRYTNGTGQELKNVFLQLTYPAHFQLQELFADETPTESNALSLGNLAPEATGSIKIRGIMFGDVGGEQTFESKITFTYGQKERAGQKISQHVFRPASSVLKLALQMPEKIVASQTFTGRVVYKNTGEFDLPETNIQPTWPEKFNLISLSPTAWNLPAVKAGEEKTVEFTGSAENGAENLFFTFRPSFVFGNDEYKQEKLEQEVSIIQPQLKISHSVDSSTAKPEGVLKTMVKYENIGETPIYNVELFISSDSPFINDDTKWTIGTILPLASGEKEVAIKLKSSISQSETSIHEHLNLETTAAAYYQTEESDSAQKITTFGSIVSTPLITPIKLNSFGRYASDRGDQLGRGPLPPVVDDTTKYWIFWNVLETTNEIKNLTITGQLPENVEFTGRQTVSEGKAVTYDSATKIVSWQIDQLDPTFPPLAQTAGVAFEVSITPTAKQIGQTPTLISNITASGTDGWTNAWITTSGAPVTTDLPNDLMAAGLGEVME